MLGLINLMCYRFITLLLYQGVLPTYLPTTLPKVTLIKSGEMISR